MSRVVGHRGWRASCTALTTALQQLRRSAACTGTGRAPGPGPGPGACEFNAPACARGGGSSCRGFASASRACLAPPGVYPAGSPYLGGYKSVGRSEAGVNPLGVFANHEVDMGEVSWVGFDYDFTIASYRDGLQQTIYESAREYLINERQYPEGLSTREFDPGFGVRGLHYDTKRGYLLKLDFLHTVLPGNAYYGRQPLELSEIEKAYGGTHVSFAEMEHLRPLVDLFCMAEMCLMSDCIQHFRDAKVDFDASYVYEDVRRAVSDLHLSGKLHNVISADPEKYIEPSPQLRGLLAGQRASGKRLFLLTNSPFPFVDEGMRFLCGDAWRELFDVVICQADKPSFFYSNRPFRSIAEDTGKLRWQQVTSLEPGRVYLEGSLRQIQQMRAFSQISGQLVTGRNIFYVGDHVLADLTGPTKNYGWRTCAIIAELEKEVAIMSSSSYVALLGELLDAERQLRAHEDFSRSEAAQDMLRERALLRRRLKSMFNPHFGSVFRTPTGPTFFGLAVQRYSDLYTSRLENLLAVPPDRVFYPFRSSLPHEPWHAAMVPTPRHVGAVGP